MRQMYRTIEAAKMKALVVARDSRGHAVPHRSASLLKTRTVSAARHFPSRQGATKPRKKKGRRPQGTPSNQTGAAACFQTNISPSANSPGFSAGFCPDGMAPFCESEKLRLR